MRFICKPSAFKVAGAADKVGHLFSSRCTLRSQLLGYVVVLVYMVDKKKDDGYPSD